jgi:hypothetical protein
MTGSIAILCGYALSALCLERLFKIVKPKLLTLSWFNALWSSYLATRNRFWNWLRAKRMLRGKGRPR